MDGAKPIKAMQIRFRRSKLELHGPKNSLKLGPRSSRGVPSAPLFAHIPHPPTDTRLEGAPSREIAK
eukprot:5470352-Alexandrium_andersonii.AAC.1